MIISVTMKTPDALDTALDDFGFNNDEASQEVKEITRIFLGQWFEYGEYVTIDFDTVAGTATVRKKGN